ncbi:RNA-guided endonuclease InsQ/TnpB family protein [Thioclava marina]|uniref:RNA-guided endonuclease InsQ/TnpB family protein n=1 Tax=Thioclava marina TaxID=1915077 RepID=UPI000998B22A|nr:RNA-guided endonuclease TnpB family protein [Thioclava marina]
MLRFILIFFIMASMSEIRSLSYKIYPSRSQAASLWHKHCLLADLWNAALEERIGAWRRGVRIWLSDQEKALKFIRSDVPSWSSYVHTHEAQVVLKRLDLAFSGFFRRLRNGGAPGFPRFRAPERFRGWGYKQHGNGFKVEIGVGGRHGFVTLFGIGRMRMRGIARTPGRVLKADVIRAARGWMLNLVVETGCAQRERAHGPAIGLDWGVSEFATIATEAGECEVIHNPRHLATEAEDLRKAQRSLSIVARERKISSRALRKHRKSLARKHAKISARRKDFLHKVSQELVAKHRFIATEMLSPRNMTRSARGTAKAPGRNVAQKAGLNRAILDTAPSTFLNMLRYKAEEAGAELLEASTRALKPSQCCPECGAMRKKALSEREHSCSCGCKMGRDEASARVLLQWGLRFEASTEAKRAEVNRAAGTAVG